MISAWFAPSSSSCRDPYKLRWLHDVFDNSVAVATFAGETTKLYFDGPRHARAHRGGAA